jgi:hypothetical protein
LFFANSSSLPVEQGTHLTEVTLSGKNEVFLGSILQIFLLYACVSCDSNDKQQLLL